MRGSLHNYFNYVIPGLRRDLLSYADELDAVYKDIKISKVAGQSGCVVGGVLATVGFGLSFVTFGASLGLCIAGGVIAGAGGITAGGASIADFVKAKEARTKAEKQLSQCNEDFSKVLEKFQEISGELEQFGDIEYTFPVWCDFWASLILGSGKVATGFGWKMVANTVINAVRLAKGIDVATDVTSASLPVFRTLGTAMKGVHIAGGVVGAVFLPIDVFFLVSNSIELHKKEAHVDSKRIRRVAAEIKQKCLKAKTIDNMIDKCIAVLRQ